MELRCNLALVIKKENEGEKIFTREDDSITWVHLDSNELFCLIPNENESKIVAITISPYDNSSYELNTIQAKGFDKQGKLGGMECKRRAISNEVANRHIDDGIIVTSSGTVFKLMIK